MVIDQVHISHVSIIKPEDHTPVGPDRHGPGAFQVSLQRVQPESRQVKVARLRRAIKKGQNILDFIKMFRRDPAPIALFEEALQAAMAENSRA